MNTIVILIGYVFGSFYTAHKIYSLVEWAFKVLYKKG